MSEKYVKVVHAGSHCYSAVPFEKIHKGDTFFVRGDRYTAAEDAHIEKALGGAYVITDRETQKLWISCDLDMVAADRYEPNSYTQRLLDAAIKREWNITETKDSMIQFSRKEFYEYSFIIPGYDICKEIENISYGFHVNKWVADMARPVLAEGQTPDFDTLVSTATRIQLALRDLATELRTVPKWIGRKALWVRLGADIYLDESEYSVFCSEDGTAARKLLENKVYSGDFILNGESYAPDTDGDECHWPAHSIPDIDV